MNVCTHSYTLVWYTWQQWSVFIDWLALSGINMVYGLTGQEEVQWRVFSAFNVSDSDIRRWFNGPAFLTWSRGQNSHGGSIAGPLPRSWMQAQWDLQRLILARTRPLGMVGQLPAFQGNVPAALKALSADPYDDELMEAFCAYLEQSRQRVTRAETLYRSLACPEVARGFGLSVYHCLGQVQDALTELERYTLGYVDSYLHDGREMLREARRRRQRLQEERRRLEL
jgi:hypothetical protein